MVTGPEEHTEDGKRIFPKKVIFIGGGSPHTGFSVLMK